MSNELTSFNGADAFEDNTSGGVAYGTSPTLYVRCKPTNSLTQNVGGSTFVIAHEPSLLLSGAGDTFPAFAAPDAAGIDGASGCFLSRATWRSNVDVRLDQRLSYINGGSSNDDGLDYYLTGVWARVREGTFVAASGSTDEYHSNITGYFFGQISRDFAGSPEWYFVLFRFNAGVITELGKRVMPPIYSGSNATQYGVRGPTRLRLRVETISGNPNLTASYDSWLTGSPVETLVSWAGTTTYEDTALDKIASPGRCGFSITTARNTGGGGQVPIVLARRFSIHDLSLPDDPFLDDNLFTRRDLKACRSYTDPMSGKTGDCLMSLYSGDLFGNRVTSSPLNDGFYGQLLRSTSTADAAKVGDVVDTSSITQTMGWHLSQRESFDAPDAHADLIFTMVNFSGQQTAVGIALRAVVQAGEYGKEGQGGQNLDSYKQGYAAVVHYTGAAHEIRVYHYPFGGARTLIADASITLTYGNETEIDFEIQNIDNGGGTQRPALRVKYGQPTATITATLVPKVSGVVFNSSSGVLLDDRTTALGSGSGMGPIIDRDDPSDQASPVAVFDRFGPIALSSDFNLDGGGGVGEDEDDTEYESVAFRAEVDGANGTLEIPVHWPVRTDEKWLLNSATTRTRLNVVRPRAQEGRRRWTVSVPAEDSTEAAYLRQFVSARGAAVAFQWEEPIHREMVFGRFTRDSVRTLIRAPEAIGAYDFEIDELFNPYEFELPEATFERHTSVVSGSTVYAQAHVLDTQGNYTITVNLSGSGAGIDGTLVGYKITSLPGAPYETPVEGVHYEITAGASPLTFNEGETSKTITVNVLNPASTWFRERGMRFVMDEATSSFVTFGSEATNSDSPEFRLFIRSTDSIPVIDFGSASSTWLLSSGSYFHTVQMSRTGATNEHTEMWFTVSGGTAVEGTDFRIAAGSEPGARTIAPGVGSGTIVIEALPGYTKGRTVQLSIDYEAASGADENLAPFTDTTRAESEQKGGEFWPGISGLQPYVPTSRIYGPDAALDGTGMPWDSFFSASKLTTQGEPAPGLTFRYRNFSGTTAYYRDGFNAWFFCDATDAIWDIEAYNQWSFYWATEPGKPAPRFIGISWRDRANDTNSTIVWDREAGGLGKTDYNGNPYTGNVTTDEGVWNIYRLDEGMPGTLASYGVVEETIDGVKHTRLYGEYEATAGELASPFPVVMLAWPVYDSSSRIKPSDQKDKEDLDGYSCLFYGLMKKQGSSAHSDPPDRYWPRKRAAYEPRGNARSGSTTTTHTVTLDP